MKYETGVSGGVIYGLGGESPVPWPGIISVEVSFPDAKQVSLTYEGQVYYNRSLKSRCKATVKAFDFPKELYNYIGYREVVPGIGLYIPGYKQEVCMFSFVTETDDGYKTHVLSRALISKTGGGIQTHTNIELPSVQTFSITTESFGNYFSEYHPGPPPEEFMFPPSGVLMTSEGEFLVHDDGKILI